MKTISVAEAREIDRAAVEELGMPSLVLMENAAHGVAAAARQLGEDWIVLCGPGNNGGDGLAAARLLGPRARVSLLSEPDPEKSPDAALQLRILRAAGWSIRVSGDAPRDARRDVVWIDALFGTGLGRAVEGRAADWIAAMNAAPGRRLAVDVPSGLDADRGEPLSDACIRAHVTVTFESAKHGLVAASARPFVGRLEVAPLGLPARGTSAG